MRSELHLAYCVLIPHIGPHAHTHTGSIVFVRTYCKHQLSHISILFKKTKHFTLEWLHILKKKKTVEMRLSDLSDFLFHFSLFFWFLIKRVALDFFSASILQVFHLLKEFNEFAKLLQLFLNFQSQKRPCTYNSKPFLKKLRRCGFCTTLFDLEFFYSQKKEYLTDKIPDQTAAETFTCMAA